MSVQEYGNQPASWRASTFRVVPERAALGHPAGRADRRGRRCRRRMALSGRGRLRIRPMGTGENYDFKAITEKVLADAISSTADPASDVRVRGHVIEAMRQVLLDASGGADLLVLGSRGTADSPKRCSARSASTACITRAAPFS